MLNFESIILSERKKQLGCPVLKMGSDNWGLVGLVFAINWKIKKYAKNVFLIVHFWALSHNHQTVSLSSKGTRFLCEEKAK